MDEVDRSNSAVEYQGMVKSINDWRPYLFGLGKKLYWNRPIFACIFYFFRNYIRKEMLRKTSWG